MKKKKIPLILLSFLIIGLFSTLFITDVVGASTLDFTFEKDVFLSDSNPSFDGIHNVRNQTEYTGHYPATYSFENESDGTSGVNIGFVNISQMDTVEIVSNYLGHEKVIYFEDGEGGQFRSFMNPQIIGTVEVWLNNPMVQDYYFMILSEGYGCCYIRYISKTTIRIYYGVSTYETVTIISDAWVHAKISFNCSTDKYSIWINGVLELDDKSFVNNYNVNTLDRIDIYSSDACEGYLDAIGYSWDDSYTYNFNDDTIGQYPVGWNIYDNDNCYSLVKAELDGEINVLEFEDGTGVGKAHLKRNISQRGNQTIEFDIATELIEESKEGIIVFKEGIIDIFSIKLIEDDLHDVGTHTVIKENFIVVNEFFRIRIVLDDEANTYDCYVDGVLELANIVYGVSTTISIDSLSFMTVVGYSMYSFYVDNIWISSDYEEYGYITGSNRNPILNETGLLEADKWGFTRKAFRVYYQEGDDNPKGWVDVEVGGDYTNIKDYGGGLGKAVEMKGLFSINNEAGIKRTTYNEANLLNISWGFNRTQEDVVANFTFTQKSNDSSLITKLVIDDWDLDYYNGSEYIELDINIINQNYYEFNLFTNYEAGLSILRIYTNGVFADSFEMPLIEPYKIGLSEIMFNVDATESLFDNTTYYLDYCGIYINGVSNTTAHAQMRVLVSNSETWVFKNHNIFEYTTICGNLSLHLRVSNVLLLGFTWQITYNENVYGSEIKNLYDFYIYYIATYYYSGEAPCWVYLEFYGDIDGFGVDISGVDLWEGENEYQLSYSHNGIDIDESYFWVENNNLKYNLIVNDDSVEYIQANFDIANLPSVNRSVSFKSTIQGNSKGFLRVSYADATSTVLEFPYYLTTTSLILPQTKGITELIVLITDNDVLSNDNCSGYITNLKLIYYPDISITITTTNLLEVIIPLMIMIVPPLAMRKRFGISGVIVMFVLMSVLCVATSLIPVWLFFVICLSLMGFLVMKKKIGDDSEL